MNPKPLEAGVGPTHGLTPELHRSVKFGEPGLLLSAFWFAPIAVFNTVADPEMDALLNPVSGFVTVLATVVMSWLAPSVRPLAAEMLKLTVPAAAPPNSVLNSAPPIVPKSIVSLAAVLLIVKSLKFRPSHAVIEELFVQIWTSSPPLPVCGMGTGPEAGGVMLTAKAATEALESSTAAIAFPNTDFM